MKALTVWQPWASLIAEGHKPYEFRSWPAPKWIVGERLAIHAGARQVTVKEIRTLYEGLRGVGGRPKPALLESAAPALACRQRHQWPLGVIVAVVTVGGPKHGLECAEELGCEVNDSDREGTFNWGWPMLDVSPIPPVVCRGAQGLWPVPADICSQIEALATALGGD